MARSSMAYWLFHETADQIAQEGERFTDDERTLIGSRMAQAAFYFQEGSVTTPTTDEDEKDLLHQMVLLRAHCQLEKSHALQPSLIAHCGTHQSDELGAYDALELSFDYHSAESYAAIDIAVTSLRRAFERSCGQSLQDRLSESIVGITIMGPLRER